MMSFLLTKILGCLLLGVGILSQMVYASEEDQQLKALFLYNFANFVEWPPAAFNSPSEPLRLCLIGRNSFSAYLRIFDQTMIRDRELRVIETSDMSVLSQGCHILFVGEDKKNQLNNFMENNEHQFVLSISTIENFVEEGGVVTIFRNQDQVQFDVNLSVALKNGLFISSDLLSLARVIKQEQ